VPRRGQYSRAADSLREGATEGSGRAPIGHESGESVMTAVELVADKVLTCRFALERAKGIEPS